MEKRNITTAAHLENSLNREAVFAQMEVLTDGCSFNDSFELFRKNRKRQKVGDYADTMTVEDLINLALVVYEARQLTRPSHECGRYLGFSIQMIFDGGIKSHVEVSSDGEVSEEFEDWYGHKPIEFLDDDDVPVPAPVIRRPPRTPLPQRRPAGHIRPRRKTV